MWHSAALFGLEAIMGVAGFIAGFVVGHYSGFSMGMRKEEDPGDYPVA